MNIDCQIQIKYKNKETAQKILGSIKVDDYQFVNSKINKTTLEATIQITSISSLIHTLDDYLACISVAETIVDKN
jgi:hypothetical protein